MAYNPRHANGAARRKLVKRLKASGEPCWLCGKPIDLSLGMVTDPRTGKRRPHPMSFVVDEVVPVSQGGSPIDPENCRPAHWICNARRGDGTRAKAKTKPLPLPFDDW